MQLGTSGACVSVLRVTETNLKPEYPGMAERVCLPPPAPAWHPEVTVDQLSVSGCDALEPGAR
eukprot:3188177-Rhodomonas_salina.1